ncbi:MAG: hypothetical protein Kow00107_07690 [Planctomycetota bacterium]
MTTYNISITRNVIKEFKLRSIEPVDQKLGKNNGSLIKLRNKRKPIVTVHVLTRTGR